MQIFSAAIKLEKHLNEKRNAIGRDTIYIHPMVKGRMYPLGQAVPNQLSFFDMEEMEEMEEDDLVCIDSSCMT